MNFKKILSAAAAAVIAVSASIPALAEEITVTWNNGQSVTDGGISTGTLSEVITRNVTIEVTMKMLGNGDVSSEFVLKDDDTDVITISKAGWTTVPYMVKDNTNSEAKAVLSYDSGHKEADSGPNVQARTFEIKLDFDSGTYTVTAEKLENDKSTVEPTVVGRFSADSIDSLYIHAADNDGDTVSISSITIEQENEPIVTYNASQQFSAEDGYEGNATAVKFTVTPDENTSVSKITIGYGGQTESIDNPVASSDTTITGGTVVCGIVVDELLDVNAGNFGETFSIEID